MGSVSVWLELLSFGHYHPRKSLGRMVNNHCPGGRGCIRHQGTPRTHWPAGFQVPDSVSKKAGEKLSKTPSVNLQPLHVLTHTVHTPTDKYIEHTHTTII